MSGVQVLLEDRYLLAVMKPAGVVVHGSPDSLEEVLSDAHGRQLVLLHRLDKETSGILLFAKRKDAAGAMSRAFEDKKIRKCYFAVVSGRWPKELNRVESMIDRDRDGGLVSRKEGTGKKALTTFRALAASEQKSWIEAMPKTGRTHQIRLHCAGAGHAILGDRTYGRALENDPPQALHAYRLDFRHPITGEDVKIVAEPPDYWKTTWLSGLNYESTYRKIFE